MEPEGCHQWKVEFNLTCWRNPGSITHSFIAFFSYYLFSFARTLSCGLPLNYVHMSLWPPQQAVFLLICVGELIFADLITCDASRDPVLWQTRKDSSWGPSPVYSFVVLSQRFWINYLTTNSESSPLAGWVPGTFAGLFISHTLCLHYMLPAYSRFPSFNSIEYN
jgi:hypothetical protein